MPPDTVIEIIATKDGKHYKMIMTVAEWLVKPKSRKFKYQMFQLGFSQFLIEK